MHKTIQHCIIAGQNVLDHGNYLVEVQIKMPQGKICILHCSLRNSFGYR